ncbi:type II toxin-antitoxin system HicB family antitoxin [Alicyclobacillus suci]|uniref:type II toxin-antitoxin system HicB family antitoxin n=1 Tax=Alicyclobacillus suci TaxID=2816080 RepID=UPI001A90134D|nr:hypothetical protein [Alicyclobacillus suci]
MTVEEYLAIPYILQVWSRECEDGRWVRHAEFPELPGCFAEASSAVEAVERAEAARVVYIVEKLARGEAVPVPRPPLEA